MNADDFLSDESPILGVKKLTTLGGRYSGVIVTVGKRLFINRYKRYAAESQIVLTFADGLEAVLNRGMIKTLVNLYGAETDGWVGHVVTISLHAGKRSVMRGPSDKDLARRELVDVNADRDRFSAHDVEPADYDDSPAALDFGSRKRKVQ